MTKTQTAKSTKQKIIIAIGASAGGLDPIKDFLINLPKQLSQASIILAQHSGNASTVMLKQILSKETGMMIAEAKNKEAIKPGIVYLCPPKKDVFIQKGLFLMQAPAEPKASKPNIDSLFESVAKIKNSHRIGIILSGNGNDGAQGCMAIKKAGGAVLVQEPTNAKYKSMPMATIEKKCVDAVLLPKMMGNKILQIMRQVSKKPSLSKPIKTIDNNDVYAQLFQKLLKNYGTDFSQYKSSTIFRRIDKRMSELQVQSIGDYLQLIQKDKNELKNLYKSFLIAVTAFNRDPEAFVALHKQVRNVCEKKKGKDEFRVWIIGCSTGEEAYSIAINIYEVFKQIKTKRSIRVFATDIDEDSLKLARKGSYKAAALEPFSKTQIQKYFSRNNQGEFTIHKNIRALISFSKHDITTNPPFSNIDLISCRNLLIYFQIPLQKQVLSVLHYSMNEHARLFLGKSESIGKLTDYFIVADFKNKFFSKKLNSKPLFMRSSAITNTFSAKKTLSDEIQHKANVNDLVRETLINTLDSAYVIVNEDADIQEVKGNVRPYLSLSEGTMNNNLFKLLNLELQASTREAFKEVLQSGKPFKTKLKRFSLLNLDYFVVINVKPLVWKGLKENYFLILFEQLELPEIDVLSYKDQVISKEAKYKKIELELASTKKELQNYIEELESNYEELQVTNEELQSTNEELQITNEELQSTNEELESTNEELNVVNKQKSLIADNISLKEKELQHFSYMVSHNLRSPIATIMGVCNIMLEKPLDEKQTKFFVEAIQKSAKNLDGVIKDLNQILSIKNVEMAREPVHFSEVLEDVKKSLMFKIDSQKVTIKADFSEVDEIFSVSNYLNSIFMNLISNSIKYAKRDLAPVISIVSKRKKDAIELIFKDNGIGINLRLYKDKIFGLYNRFHGEFAEGTGVGLYLVKLETQTLNGSIEVESEINVGTVFTIHFNLKNNER